MKPRLVAGQYTLEEGRYGALVPPDIFEALMKARAVRMFLEIEPSKVILMLGGHIAESHHCAGTHLMSMIVARPRGRRDGGNGWFPFGGCAATHGNVRAEQ